MVVNWMRVIVISGALVTVAAGALSWQYTRPSKPIRPTWAPWIGLPATAMDMSSQHVREALFNLGQLEGYEKGEAPGETLIQRCGEDVSAGDDPDVSEIYVARMADSSFAGARGWHVKFSVEGEKVLVSIQDAIGFVAPPLPPEPGLELPQARSPPHARKDVVFTRSQLQPIADAWRDRQLWDAPQETVECTDGMPSILEACIHGQYAMRDRRCSAAAPQAMALWKTIQRVLPAPEGGGSPPGGVD